MEGIKLFEEAKAPGLDDSARLSIFAAAIRAFNSALPAADSAQQRATLHHNIGAAYFQCVLIHISPEQLVPRLVPATATRW
jgi:hypothetical protein